ncbi:hypothetical protein D3C79_875890 [compost metagenome]
MDIEIHDQHPLAAPLVETDLRRNHQIVEQAEAAAKVPVGMMITAGDLQAAAVLESVTAGGDSGPDRVQGAFNQHGRPGKAESAYSLQIEPAGEGRVHIVSIVDAR